MISFGEDKYKPALKEMWKLCFPADTDIFVDFYFSEVYKNNETLIYLKNGQPAATFQMIPYSLQNGGEISQSGYISGAMTHPNFRRKGFMKALMFVSFDLMWERGFDYTFLIPQEAHLFDFYAKFGYKTVLSPENFISRYEDTGRNVPYCAPCTVYRAPLSMPKTILREIYIAYSHFLSEIPRAVLKTEKQFQQILHDFFDENGVLFVGGQGIAFTFQGKNRIVIKEFFYRNQQVKDLFLKAIRDYYSQEETVILNSPAHLSGLRGMIKQLNGGKPEISNLYINMMLEGFTPLLSPLKPSHQRQ